MHSLSGNFKVLSDMKSYAQKKVEDEVRAMNRKKLEILRWWTFEAMRAIRQHEAAVADARVGMLAWDYEVNERYAGKGVDKPRRRVVKDAG